MEVTFPKAELVKAALQ